MLVFHSFNLYLLLSHYLPGTELRIQEREMKDMIFTLFSSQSSNEMRQVNTNFNSDIKSEKGNDIECGNV